MHNIGVHPAQSLHQPGKMSQYVFGELLVKYRKWAGHTQQELSTAISYHRNMVGQWERSERLPDRETVLLIARELELDGRRQNELLQAAGYAPEPLQGGADIFIEPTPPASFQRTVMAGMQMYLPDLTTAIKNFLYQYLGDAQNPVPFGGRDKALAQLERWRTQEDAPPRLLLTAPAGRGKSALLVRWLDQLQNSSDVAVVFMPISIRFGTNSEEMTFRLLATRLAHLYGKQVPAEWGKMTAALWRGFLAEYLQEPLPDGRQLLVVIDGLDEAAWRPGGDLFPMQLPEQVRIVLSARHLGGEVAGPEPWLRRLSWDRFPQMAITMELQSLTRADVRDVLEKMDCPLDKLGRNVDIVDELHRLSEGDPLLVELYVKELWQRGEAAAHLQPEDLQGMRPGYNGYFERWWTDQEELWGEDDPLEKKIVNDLLDVLAMALGPLPINDLRQLLPGNVRSRELRRAIEPLNRFVIGNGQEQGYAFAHPKLGEYFRDVLEADEQAAWQQRFLDWGRWTLANLRSKKIRPLDASPYLMQYYGRHLEETNATTEELMQLVSREWLQVWYQKTDTHAGFLQDVDRVWTRLQMVNAEAINQGEKAPYIGQEILCTLCHVSVNSLANNIPDELLILHLKQQIWTEKQVMVYISQRIDIEKRLEAFMLILPHLSPEAKVNFGQELVVAAARELSDAPNQDRVLTMLLSITLELPKERRLSALETLLSAARRTKSEIQQSIMLTTIAQHLPKNRKIAVLREALLTIEFQWRKRKNLARKELGVLTWHRAKVLEAAACSLPRVVLCASRTTGAVNLRRDILLALTSCLPREVLKEIISRPFGVEYWDPYEYIDQIAGNWLDNYPYWPENSLSSQTRILQAVASQLPPEEVFLIAQELQSQEEFGDWGSAALLVQLATCLPEAVYQASKSFENNFVRAALLRKLLPILPSKFHITDEIFFIAKQLQDEDASAALLFELAPHLPNEVYQAAQGIQNEWSRAIILVRLIDQLSEKSSVVEEVLLIAEKFQNQGESTYSLIIKLKPYLPQDKFKAILRTELQVGVQSALRKHGDYDKALQYKPDFLWYQINYKNSFALLLSELLPYLPEEVLEIINEIKDDDLKAEWLNKTIPHVPASAVLEASRTIYSEYARSEVLIILSPHIPEEVYLAAQDFKHKQPLARVLSHIIQFFPPEKQFTVLQEAYQAARTIQDNWSKVELLNNLAVWLPEEVFEHALTLSDQYERIDLLCKASQHLPQNKYAASMEEILMLIRSCPDDEERIGKLCLVRYLPGELQSEVIKEVVEAVQHLRQKEELYIEAMRWLIPYMEPELQKSVIKEILPTLQNANLDSLANAQRGELVEDDCLEEILLALERSESPLEVKPAKKNQQKEPNIHGTLGQLDKTADKDSQQYAEAQSNQAKRSAPPPQSANISRFLFGDSLYVLAPYAPEEVLELTRKLDSFQKRRILTKLAPLIPEQVISQMLPVTTKEEAELLAEALPHLDSGRKKAILDKILTAVESVEDVESTEDKEKYASILIRLLPLMSPKQQASKLKELERMALSIRSDWSRAEEISHLLSSLRLEKRLTMFTEAFVAAQMILFFPSREKVIRRSVDSLAPLPVSHDLYTLWNNILFTLRSQRREECLSQLSALLPLISKLGGQKGLRSLLDGAQSIFVWWP